MKKGISLIVLVITIIIMIIIAGAIILSLNSSNVTNRANWAQVSADRANLQSEFAVILSDTIAEQKIGDGQDYIGVTVSDIEANAKYTAWKTKVDNTNTRFEIYKPDETNPASMKVVMYIDADEAKAFGLTVANDGATIVGYDWVRVGSKNTAIGTYNTNKTDWE